MDSRKPVRKARKQNLALSPDRQINKRLRKGSSRHTLEGSLGPTVKHQHAPHVVEQKESARKHGAKDQSSESSIPTAILPDLDGLPQFQSLTGKHVSRHLLPPAKMTHSFTCGQFAYEIQVC